MKKKTYSNHGQPHPDYMDTKRSTRLWQRQWQ